MIVGKNGELMHMHKLLDCTLRDGSYAVDFQFTTTDTENIVQELDDAGFPYIEIGHGIGLGASERGKNIAAASDTDYMKAAVKSIKKSKWGMFCIPGIAKLDHIKIAADFGINFLRIGSDVNEINSSLPFIELARKLNIEVYANFMKSYVLTPLEFARLAKKSYDFGAQLIYLVDSAGSMLPNEIKTYLKITREESPNIPLGFHGHNNLGLAVANSLVCVEEGVSMIDVSLQGLGRSSGNTPTEQFVSALSRAGYKQDIDPIKTMHLGEIFIRKKIERRGLCSLDTVAGLAQFHSSYMPTILSAAKKYSIDPRVLIIELCRHTKINAPKDLIEKIASTLEVKPFTEDSLPWPNYYGEEQSF